VSPTNTKMANQDVLSFLESLDELTAAPKKASKPSAAPPPQVPGDVLSFLDELTASKDTKPKAPPKHDDAKHDKHDSDKQEKDKNHTLPPTNSLIASVPLPTGTTPPPPQPQTGPPNTGFVQKPSRAKRVAPPELTGQANSSTFQTNQTDFPILMNTATGSTLVNSTLNPASTSVPGSVKKPEVFKPEAFKPETSSPLVTGNVISNTPETYKSWWSEQEPGVIQQPRTSQDQPVPQARQEESGWSWGTLLNTGSKLLETAKEQVAQAKDSVVQASANAQVSERLKKMNITTDKFKNIGEIGSYFVSFDFNLHSGE
jgi:hypothetical protein